MFNQKMLNRISDRYLILLVMSILAAPAAAQSDQSNGALREDERSSVMFDFNMKKVRENPMMKDVDVKEMMQKGGIPTNEEFDVTKVNRIFGGIQIPGDPSAMQPQPGEKLKTNFYVRFEFNDASAADKMIDSIQEKGAETKEVNGKTYYRPVDNDAPPNLRLHRVNKETVEMGTERYILNDDRNFVSKKLSEYWNQVPKDSAIRISIDLESNRSMFDQLMEMAKAGAPPEAAPLLSIVNDLSGLTLSLDFDSNNLLMLRASGKDTAGTEKLRTGIDGLLGMGKFFGQQGLSQSSMDEKAKNVFGEILKSLKATADGNIVRVDVTKPDGFDDVVSEMMEN